MTESWEDDDESGTTLIGSGARQAQDQYVRELAMDRFRQVLDDPSYALSQDPETWRRIRRDAHFAFLIGARRSKCASRGWRIVPATEDPADRVAAGIVEQALRKIPRFWMTRYNLAAADFRGTAYAALTGQLRTWQPLVGLATGGTRPAKAAPREWWMFNRLVDVDRYRFRTIPNHQTGEWKRELFSPARGKWEPLEHPEWFIRHVFDDSEDSRGHGTGLLDPLYMIWYSKMTCLELGLQGVEAWANGRLDVAVDGMRDPSGVTNQAVVNAWRAQVRNWVRDHALVHDAIDKVTMTDGPSQGSNMAVEFVRYCDNSASQLVLGAILPFGGDQGAGSLSRAEEEGRQSDEYLQPSRELLGETLTDSLVQTWWSRNWGNLCELGLRTAEPPKLELYSEPRKDALKNAQVLEAALKHGDVQSKEFYDKLDLTQPGPEDARIAKAEQPAGFGLGGFNFDGPGGQMGQPNGNRPPAVPAPGA